MGVELFDEMGNAWKVRAGDPAARTVARLTRLGYQKPIVLPMITLATGQTADAVQEPVDVIHAQRLRECAEALT